MSDLFLTHDEVVELTGWKNKKKQIAQLRRMGLPFWVNGREEPVVPRVAITGRPTAPFENVRERVVPLAFRTESVEPIGAVPLTKKRIP
jgi:hypothetical protein